MPACIHSSIEAGTSGRTGSEIAVIPIKCKPFTTSLPFSEITALGSSITLYAKPIVRIAWFWYCKSLASKSACEISERNLPPSWQKVITISGAPFTYNTGLPRVGDCTKVAIYLRSVEKVSCCNTSLSSRIGK